MYFQNFAPIYSPFAGGSLLALMIPFVLAAIVWTILLKGFSLWYAARGGQKWWFIVLLVVNTLGILEIVYLIWFRPATPEKPSPIVHSSSAA